MSLRNYLEEAKKEKKEEDWSWIEKGYSGAEIAQMLGVTRQAVSNTLKRAMTKVYSETRKVDKTWGPFEAAVANSQIFGVDQDSPEELKKFFKLFPPKIRKEIEEDAKRSLSSKKN
jgi:DNA-binding CsgD family transcriptional regulator